MSVDGNTFVNKAYISHNTYLEWIRSRSFEVGILCLCPLCKSSLPEGGNGCRGTGKIYSLKNSYKRVTICIVFARRNLKRRSHDVFYFLQY